MNWSTRIGKVFDIDLYVHLTLLLLLGFIGLSHWQQTRDLTAAAAGVGFFVALFMCVLLHELGHALMARKYGIKTRGVTLLPIGGLAQPDRFPDKPMQELWVAVAGPVVNLVIAGVLYAYLFATPPLGQELSTVDGSFLARLASFNLLLVVFNMLPAFPMDGGRVLRALLATRMDYSRATNIAARMGQGLAFVFGFIGVMPNPMLVFTTLFVWIGSAQEAAMAQMKASLSGIPLERVMITDFRTLSPADPLSRAVDHILAGFQQDFPVIDASDRLVGVLTRTGLIAALSRHAPTAEVGEVMQREFKTAAPFELAQDVLDKLSDCECRALPIVRDGRLVGLLTAENLGEFLMIQAALRPAKPPHGTLA